MFLVNLHLFYPEKNSVEAEESNQHKNDDVPVANPKWVFSEEWKQNIRGMLVTPHVKEDVRQPTDEATEINRLERILHLFGEKPEKVVNTEDGFAEPSLRYINNQT
jgi:hypothetical protein